MGRICRKTGRGRKLPEVAMGEEICSSVCGI
jgi:hypothetical protein